MRLIDAEALKETIVQNYRREFFGSILWNILDDIPTIDAIPVVRCRDCMHCLWDERHKDKKGRCMEHHIWCEADGFCHMGEKLDGGASDG